MLNYTGGQRNIPVRGSTVAECLDSLIAQFPDIGKRIFHANGDFQAVILVGTKTIGAKELDKPVTDGEELVLLSAMGGG